MIEPPMQIVKKGLDPTLLKKRGTSKTYGGWLIQKYQDARKDKNFEMAKLLETLYKKYKEFENSEKIMLKRWRGKKGEMKFWNKPDSIVIEFAQSRNKDQEPRRATKEYNKYDINRMIWCLNKLKEESNNKIPSRKLGELFYKRDWDSKIFSQRGDHTSFTHILNILDYYKLIHYSGGVSTILKEVKEIQEILK